MMKTHYAIEIKPGKQVQLSKIETSAHADETKESAAAKLIALGEQLNHLQEMLYAAGTHSLLVVLQGMDTSGKDGAIRGVMRYFNPQGCRVESFKAPSSEELAHDFLWRVHKVTPSRGVVGVFNRSHYEDVLASRVQKLVPEKVWKARYRQINNFEESLAQNNTIIVKAFLHISEDEQEKRLLAREADIEKAWKLAVNDWEQRRLWSHYQSAYEDAIGKCSTPAAPWFVLPADRKWFRNLALAELLVETLKPYEKEWRGVLDAHSKKSLEELKAYRAGELENGASKS